MWGKRVSEIEYFNNYGLPHSSNREYLSHKNRWEQDKIDKLKSISLFKPSEHLISTKSNRKSFTVKVWKKLK
jgi:hypothetical protein